MPRGGSRPGAGRKPKRPAEGAAKPVVDESGKKTAAAPPNWPFGTEPQKPEEPEDLSKLMPLDFLLSVMRDAGEETGRRMQAATLAAPFCHPKMDKASSKKKTDEDEKPAGRFTRRQPPQLVTAGGKKI